MEIIQILLIVATFLCSLVAGFLFAFTIVVMPGIKQLNDKEFIHSFQVMDRIIQNNQPLFMLVWGGSVLAIIGAGVPGIWQLDGIERLLVIFAAVLYLLGVQLTTIAVNVPLNNRLQTCGVERSNQESLKKERQHFEPQWTRWNFIRTVASCVTSLLLLVLLYRL